MIESDLAAIQRLLTDFAWSADHGDGAAMSELFLPEAILIVGGQELKGRAQIADDCYRRALDPQRKTRHIWSNLRVDPQGDGTVAGTAIQLTYEQTGEDQPTRLRVNDLIDMFKRDAQGEWRFMSRIIARQMALAF